MDKPEITMPEAARLAAKWGYDILQTTLTHAAWSGDLAATKYGPPRRGFWLTTEAALRAYLERYHPRPRARRQ